MTDPLSPAPRPRIVDAAFWLLAVGAVMLLFGGLMAVSTSFEAFKQLFDQSVSEDIVRGKLALYRGAGVFGIVAGAILAFVAGKSRTGDPRFRRAAIALALAAVVLVCLFTVVAGANPVTVLALVPVIVGALLLSRPSAALWFGRDRESTDG